MPEQEMLFGDYLRVVFKRKWTVILLAILVVGCTWAWASRQKPTFKSSTLIKIQRVQSFAEFLDEVMVSSTDPLNNYVLEITSSRVLERAANTLAETDYACSADTLRATVEATRMEGTDHILIIATAPSGEASQARAKSVGDAFRIHHDASLTQNARELKQDIEAIREDRLKALNADKDRLRAQLGEAAFSEAGFDEIALLRSHLSETGIKLATLRSNGNYTEAYPEIVECKSRIAAIEKRLEKITEDDQAIRAKVQQYEQKRAIADEMDQFFTKQLEEARIAEKRKTERVSVIEEPRLGIKTTTTTAYLLAVGLLLGVMLGIVTAFVAENLDTSIRTLVEIEEAFKLPILGVIPNFTRATANIPVKPEGFWNRIRYSSLVHSTTLVWRAIGQFLTGGSRRKKRSQAAAGTLIVCTAPRSPATEGYRSVRTSLQFAEGADSIRPFLVTSPGPAEGKSTTISNLAITMAQTGKKVLLVGANMRRPSLYRVFGLERERGLSEVLVGDMSWRDVVKDYRDIALGRRVEENLATAAGMENFFLITCGGRTIQPAEWLSQPVFAALVKEWEEEYDAVLVDGPPVLPVPDSAIMAGAIGRTVLVYQGGNTQRDSMHRTISSIRNAGSEILGLVLNDLRASWSASPDYFHYRGYYGRPDDKRNS